MDDDLEPRFIGGVYLQLVFWRALTGWIIAEARGLRRRLRHRRARETLITRLAARRPRSLNPPPDAAAVSAQWRRTRGSLLETLRFGSLLLDLEPTVDNSLVKRWNKAGTREVIVARNPGLKGWLHRECRAVGYQTAMRYKTLAKRVRQACGMPADVPLEWIFPDQAGRDAERAATTSSDLAAARARLVEFLVGCGSVARLSARLDETLEITHRKLAQPRRGAAATARRRTGARAVEALLGAVRARAFDPARPLDAEARQLLLGGLLTAAEELRTRTASPPAA
jgi:hypothetical protein